MRRADSVLLYYHYVELDEIKTKKTREQQLEWCRNLDLMGRIRVTPEGLNGTLDGTNENLEEYTKRMNALYQPATIDWKWATYPAECERRFQSVSVKIKDEVVGMVLSDAERRGMMEAPSGKHLTASEWHEELKKDDENMILIDVRNFYETRIGHFRYGSKEENKAVDPMTRSFSEFKYFVEKEADSLKDKKVLMYCTGGVRCERASQYMHYKGINNVYQLYGGIHRYQEEYPEGFFKGKNFVYDPRVAVGASNDVKDNEHPVREVKKVESSCGITDIFNWVNFWGWNSTDTASTASTASRMNGLEGSKIVGQCMLCRAPHDDYHSPYDKGASAQTRCSYCRVLCLVCNACKGNEMFRKDIKALRCEMCTERGQIESTTDTSPLTTDAESVEASEAQEATGRVA